MRRKKKSRKDKRNYNLDTNSIQYERDRLLSAKRGDKIVIMFISCIYIHFNGILGWMLKVKRVQEKKQTIEKLTVSASLLKKIKGLSSFDELSPYMVNYFFKLAGRECWYSIACFENCQMEWAVAATR